MEQFVFGLQRRARKHHACFTVRFYRGSGSAKRVVQLWTTLLHAINGPELVLARRLIPRRVGANHATPALARSVASCHAHSSIGNLHEHFTINGTVLFAIGTEDRAPLALFHRQRQIFNTDGETSCSLLSLETVPCIA